MSNGYDASKAKLGSSASLGNGYTIRVENTVKGKRWVIYDQYNHRVPNAPVHKHVSDASSYYNKYLKNTNTFSPSAQSVDKKLEEAEKGIEQALINQKDLTEDQRKGLVDQYSFLQALNAEARRTGKKARDIVLEWDRNPELRQEGLQEANWNDKVFNYLYSMSGGDKNIEGLEDTIRQGQESRRDTIGGLHQLGEAKDQSLGDYLGLMTSENAGVPAYQSLWNTLTPEQQETMTPDKLRMLQREQELSQGKQQSAQFADLFTSLAPKEGELNLKHTDPSYDAVKNVWDREYAPNWKYGYAAPYNQREHELARFGHAKGSSSIMGNAEARKKAMGMEDIDAMTKLQNMFRSGNQGNREIIDSTTALSKAQQGAVFDPIKAEADVMGRDLQRQSNETYQDNVFAKDVAQGEINNANAEMQENASLHNLIEQQRVQELQQYKGLADEIYQYGMLGQDIEKMTGEQKNQYAQLQEKIWQDRERVVALLKSAGREEEAWELQKTANDRSAFMQKLVLGGKIAGTIAAIYFQQPQVAAAIWSPEIAKLVDPSKTPKWLGGSAKSTNNPPSGQLTGAANPGQMY